MKCLSSYKRELLGGIIGDFIGSRFEFDNIFTRDFKLIDKNSHFTDDSYMTCAVMESLTYIYRMHHTFELDKMESEIDFIENQYKTILIRNFKKWYTEHPDGDYGLLFEYWLEEGNIADTTGDSYGNGALMRVAPCAYFGQS